MKSQAEIDQEKIVEEMEKLISDTQTYQKQSKLVKDL